MASSTEQIVQEVLIRFRAEVSNLEGGAKKAKKAMEWTAEAAKESAASATKAAKATNELRLGFETVGKIGSALPGKLGPIAGSAGALTSAFKGVGTSMAAFAIAGAGVIGALVKFGPAIADAIANLFGLNDAIKEHERELALLREEQAKTVDSTRALFASIFPKEEQLRKVREQLELVKEARAAIPATLEQTRSLTLQAAALGGTDSTAFIAKREEEFKRTDKLITTSLEQLDRVELELIGRESAILESIRDPNAAKRRADALKEKVATGEFRLDALKVEPGEFTPFGGRPVGVNAGETIFGGVGEKQRAPETEPFFIDGDQLQTEAEKVSAALRDMDSDAQEFADRMLIVGGAITDAFEAWGSGAESLGTALKKALGSAIRDILIGEAKKHVALGAADFTIGNIGGGALHFAAAAGLSAAAGAVGNFLGAGGGSGGAGGGRLPGAAAGAFGSPGGGGGRTEVIYISNPFDDSPRQTRKRVSDALARTEREQGSGTTVIRE